jgi:methylthioribose-1-phosphate isomerase
VVDLTDDLRTVYWRGSSIEVLDQSKLPSKVSYIKLKSYEDAAEAIKTMRVRGAPLIGVVAAFALALTALQSRATSVNQLVEELRKVHVVLRSTRPTGRNLFWALDRVLGRAERAENAGELRNAVLAEALKIAEEDVETNLALAKHGSSLIENGDVILTHCNTGLGTVEHGTAIGVIKTSFRQGKKIEVIATETRPQLQGARLTTFELKREGIPFRLITDGMVGFVMAKGMVNKVLVGADRVLKDGTVINKIGTYTIAVLAKKHSIPFYVAAPTSTIDLESNVEDVAIEFRDQNEVLTVKGQRIACEGTEALNPAFDVTPQELVTAIVMETGIAHPPFDVSLRKLVKVSGKSQFQP